MIGEKNLVLKMQVENIIHCETPNYMILDLGKLDSLEKDLNIICQHLNKRNIQILYIRKNNYLKKVVYNQEYLFQEINLNTDPEIRDLEEIQDQHLPDQKDSIIIIGPNFKSALLTINEIGYHQLENIEIFNLDKNRQIVYFKFC